MVRDKALLLFLTLLFLPAVAHAADGAQCSGAGIKIDRLPDGRIRVPVSVQGRKLWFLLDTGGVATTIKWDDAKQLGLPVTQSVKKLAGIGGSLLNFQVAAQDFSVGGLRVESRPIYIEARGLSEADGTLSADILRDYDVEIDLAGGSLRLLPPGACAPAAAAVLAMDVAQNGHIRFPVRIDGKTIPATLDTGASLSLIGMRAAALLGIYPGAPELALVKDYGPYQIFAYPFQSLEFGGASVKSPHIAVASDNFIPGAAGDVILGMQALRQMHFIIAYNDRRFLILPDAPP